MGPVIQPSIPVIQPSIQTTPPVDFLDPQTQQPSPSNDSLFNKIVRAALPLVGLAFVGLTAYLLRPITFTATNTSLNLRPSNSIAPQSFSRLPNTPHKLNLWNIKSKITPPVFQGHLFTYTATSALRSFLASPPSDMTENLLLHAIGDIFGEDSGLEGGNPSHMMSYFLRVLNAKIDSIKVCDASSLPDAFCFHYAGSSYIELHKKLTWAKKISTHFRNLGVTQFSGYLKLKFSKLQPGESLFFSGGWSKHAIIYELVKQADDKLTFRTFNTGDGSEVHSCALIGLEQICLPFIERNNINIDHFCSPDIIASLQELVKEQTTLDPKLGSYDFTHRLLEAIGGDESHRIYSYEEMREPQQSGTCSYMSLLAVFSQNLKNPRQAERFVFEAELKALQDYDISYPDRYVESRQIYNLMHKGKTAFAVRVMSWIDKGIILNEEVPIVQEVINRIEANLNIAAQKLEQKALSDCPSLSFEPRIDALTHPPLEKWSIESKASEFNLENFKGSSLAFPNLQNWEINPKNLLADLKQIRSSIHSIKEAYPFTVAQTMIKQVALKLPFDDPNFWMNLDATHVKELVNLYSDLGNDLITTIIRDAKEHDVNQGFLKPSDYLAMLKFFRGADQTIQKLKPELTFGSVHQNTMDSFFDNAAVVFPLVEAEWHEEFNRLRTYWKEQKIRKIGEDFFGLDRPYTIREISKDIQKYNRNPLIPQLNWAINWLTKYPHLLDKIDEDFQNQGFLVQAVGALQHWTYLVEPPRHWIYLYDKVLPEEFYALRQLAWQSSQMLFATMNPQTNYIEVFNKCSYRATLLQDTVVFHYFEYKEIEPRLGNKEVNGKRPSEWNFRESLGAIPHKGITSHLFMDVELDEVTFPFRKRVNPNQVILDAIDAQRQLQISVLSLNSKVTLQIDETLGFFTSSIGRMDQQDYQDTFEFLMFDAGLLLREMSLPNDSHTLTTRLSKFCKRGFRLFLKRKNFSGAYFFIKMNRRFEALINQHFKEHPQCFPPNFKTPFSDAKLWIADLLSVPNLTPSLKADLIRELLISRP